jgi:hypothetical protein
MSSKSTPGAGKSGNWRSEARRVSVRRASSAALAAAAAESPATVEETSLLQGGSVVMAVIGADGGGAGGAVIVERKEERGTEEKIKRKDNAMDGGNPEKQKRDIVPIRRFGGESSGRRMGSPTLRESREK